jgi:hypothetical protein
MRSRLDTTTARNVGTRRRVGSFGDRTYDSGGAGNDGEGRKNDLVTRADPKRLDRDVQRDRAVR